MHVEQLVGMFLPGGWHAREEDLTNTVGILENTNTLISLPPNFGWSALLHLPPRRFSKRGSQTALFFVCNPARQRLGPIFPASGPLQVRSELV
jgi:hypothetical protein